MEKRMDVQEYWRQKAEELGEAILFKSIAQCYQAGLQRIGILYLTESSLFFDYSQAPRPTILQSLLGRGREEGLNQTLKIPRRELRMVRVTHSLLAKRWARKNLEPQGVMRAAGRRKPSRLMNLLFGSCLGLCTDEMYIAFDSPVNRQWEAKLSLGAQGQQ